MKWIEDLPDDFTQDFRFRFLGVQDEEAWLTRWLELGVKDWSQAVTLGRDEILKADQGRFAWTLREGDVGPDPVECVFSKNLELEGLGVADCVSMDGDLVRVSFFEQDWTSLSGIEAFAELRSLSVNACEELVDITGIGALQHLVHLGIAYCPGVVEFQEVSHLSQLQSMSLKGCDGLVGLPLLKGMTALTRLNLSQCSELDSIAGLSNLIALESIALSGCEALSSLAGIEGCSALRKLDAADCSSLADATGLSELKNLDSLDLNSCEALTDFSFLSELNSLRLVNLELCEAFDGGQSWGDCPELEEVMLNFTQIQGIDFLGGATQLKELYLENCRQLEALDGVEKLTCLQTLSLGGCGQVLDLSALQGHPSLTHLNLNACTSVTLDDFPPLPALAELEVHQSPHLDGAALLRCAHLSPQLGRLHGCGDIWGLVILWRCAARRKDGVWLESHLESLLDIVTGSHMAKGVARRWVVKALSLLDFDHISIETLFGVTWDAEEWQALWTTAYALDEEQREAILQHQFEKKEDIYKIMESMDSVDDEGDIDECIAGWLSTVVEGLEWASAPELLSKCCSFLPEYELRSGVVLLLSALRVSGLSEMEQDLLRRVTAAKRFEFQDLVSFRIAMGHAKAGRAGSALEAAETLPSMMSDEVRGELLRLWSKEMPDQVSIWLHGFHEDAVREKVVVSMVSENPALASSMHRYMLLLDIMDEQESLTDFIQTMASALPDDPWVLALEQEVLSSNTHHGSGTTHLFGLLQSDEVAEYVKPKKLQVLLDETQGQKEGLAGLEQLALALLLEHKGLIDEEEREELLAQWASKPGTV